jgi:hypothetical protein
VYYTFCLLDIPGLRSSPGPARGLSETSVCVSKCHACRVLPVNSTLPQRVKRAGFHQLPPHAPAQARLLAPNGNAARRSAPPAPPPPALATYPQVHATPLPRVAQCPPLQPTLTAPPHRASPTAFVALVPPHRLSTRILTAQYHPTDTFPALYAADPPSSIAQWARADRSRDHPCPRPPHLSCVPPVCNTSLSCGDSHTMWTHNPGLCSLYAVLPKDIRVMPVASCRSH